MGLIRFVRFESVRKFHPVLWCRWLQNNARNLNNYIPVNGFFCGWGGGTWSGDLLDSLIWGGCWVFFRYWVSIWYGLRVMPIMVTGRVGTEHCSVLTDYGFTVLRIYGFMDYLQHWNNFINITPSKFYFIHPFDTYPHFPF